MYVFVYVYAYVFIIVYCESRDGAVSTATCYGLEEPGFESRCGARFSAPFQTGPVAYPASYTIGNESLPGVKRPGHGVDQYYLRFLTLFVVFWGEGTGLLMTYIWWLFVFYILVWCFFILWLYMVYNFFLTYRVSSGPLGVGYRAMRISDSGVWSILVVRFYIGSGFILACFRVKFTLTFTFWTLFSQCLCNSLLRKIPKT